MPNCWCFPGGQLESGEDALAAAIRETDEEAGRKVAPSALKELVRTVSGAEGSPSSPGVALVEPAADPSKPQPEPAPSEPVDFTTFLCEVDAEFTPTLNDEHDGWAWAPVTAPPAPLHPGCLIALQRLSWDELHLAKAMAAGKVTSPQRYQNVTLWNMRITGTGLSYRAGLKEYVWRDASIYMNDHFRERCAGLPVIMEHPEGNMLSSKEYEERNVGSVFYPYLRPELDEVWGIVKIWDDITNEMLADEQLSTSPAVVFKSGSGNTKLGLEGGQTLLVEGNPDLLDHLAICEAGVWDKGGPPEGVDVVGEAVGDAVVMADADPRSLSDNALDKAIEKASEKWSAEYQRIRRHPDYKDLRPSERAAEFAKNPALKKLLEPIMKIEDEKWRLIEHRSARQRLGSSYARKMGDSTPNTLDARKLRRALLQVNLLAMKARGLRTRVDANEEEYQVQAFQGSQHVKDVFVKASSKQEAVRKARSKMSGYDFSGAKYYAEPLKR